MELSREAREAKNRYLREWRKNNPERARELNRRAQRKYWEKQAQKLKERNHE